MKTLRWTMYVSSVMFFFGCMFWFISHLVLANPKFGSDEFPVIQTSYGQVRGQRLESSWTKETMYCFKGIPYAAPPVRDLRFQDPVTPQKWAEVRDATKEQPVCPQTTSKSYVQSEDCLYLNVYTPHLPSPQHELLPVIVFIYGGSFLNGSGNYDDQGPDFLLAEGVVYVSFNYRLGALGFLNLGVPEAPGNAALKDQRLVLLWVQSEIRQFGGDPSRVTLFGQSVGAVSCHLHYVSPLSQGLFHRAIGNSGSALAYHPGVRTDGALYGVMLADRLNCSTEGEGWTYRGYSFEWSRGEATLPGTAVPRVDAELVANVLRCLKTADYRDILRAQAQLTDPQGYLSGLNIFGPTIDKYSSKKPFLPDFPFKLLEQKKRFFIPFIMGINSDEGFIKLRSGKEEIRNITNNLEHLYSLQVPQSCTGKLKAEKLRSFYFKYTVPSQLNIKGFVDIYTDMWYGYGTTVQAISYQKGANVFIYYFSFNGKFKDPRFMRIEKEYNYSGVAHQEELSYLFVRKSVNQTALYSLYNFDEMMTLHRMVKMWTNFAKYGTPTVGPDPLLQNVQWQPASEGRTNHLHIDVNLRMTSDDLLAPRAAVWDSITLHNCHWN